MATDAKLAVQASVTKGTTFNGTGVSLPAGTPKASPMYVRVITTDAKTTSGAGTATFRVTYSADNSTFAGISEIADTEMVLSATTQLTELFIPVVTSKPYLRLELSAITGTGATVTYQGDLVWAAP